MLSKRWVSAEIPPSSANQEENASKPSFLRRNTNHSGDLRGERQERKRPSLRLCSSWNLVHKNVIYASTHPWRDFPALPFCHHPFEPDFHFPGLETWNGMEFQPWIKRITVPPHSSHGVAPLPASLKNESTSKITSPSIPCKLQGFDGFNNSNQHFKGVFIWFIFLLF